MFQPCKDHTFYDSIFTIVCLQFLEEVMSTLKKRIEYNADAEPIRSSEVRLMEDVNLEEDTDATDMIEEKYPGELENPNESEGDDKQRIFGGPTTVNIGRRRLLSIEDDIDDEWGGDDPVIEYDAVENWQESEQEDPIIQEDYDRLMSDPVIKDNYEGMTEEEIEMDKIRLQRFLDDAVDDDEWVDVEEDETELKDGDKMEDKNGKDDMGEESSNQQREPIKSTDSTLDTKNKRTNSQQTNNDKVKDDSEVDSKKPVDEVKDDPKVDSKKPVESSDQVKEDPIVEPKPSESSRHGGPAEPSGPAKSGPSYKPKKGEMDHFAQVPTEPIEIIMDESDLNGTNRVAADGIATEEECEVLINLVKVSVMSQ